jgi:hypothetical protein
MKYEVQEAATRCDPNEAEARTWEEMKKHVYQIADATAGRLGEAVHQEVCLI